MSRVPSSCHSLLQGPLPSVLQGHLSPCSAEPPAPCLQGPLSPLPSEPCPPSASTGNPVPLFAGAPAAVSRASCSPFYRALCPPWFAGTLVPISADPLSPHLAEPKGDSQACPPSTDEDPEAGQEQAVRPNPWERVHAIISTHGETEAGKGSTAAHTPGTAAVRQAGASGRTCSWGSPRTPCKLSIGAFPLNPS